MASDWIIVGAIVVLVAGVVLFFKSAVDGPNDSGLGKKPGKNSGKGAQSGH